MLDVDEGGASTAAVGRRGVRDRLLDLASASQRMWGLAAAYLVLYWALLMCNVLIILDEYGEISLATTFQDGKTAVASLNLVLVVATCLVALSVSTPALEAFIMLFFAFNLFIYLRICRQGFGLDFANSSFHSLLDGVNFFTRGDRLLLCLNFALTVCALPITLARLVAVI